MKRPLNTFVQSVGLKILEDLRTEGVKADGLPLMVGKNEAYIGAEIEIEFHKNASKTDRVLEGRQDYVAEKLSHMSSTDGKGPSHRDCPVPVRQVHLEGLDIAA